MSFQKTSDSIWLKIFDAVKNYCPGNDGFQKDLGLLLAAVLMQVAVLGVPLIGNLIFDLVTPTITLLAIKSKLRHALALAIIAGCLIETHSAAPLGLYISSYWLITVVIKYIKPHISWRYASSWVYIFFASQMLVVTMTTITLYLNYKEIDFRLDYFGQSLFQIMIAIIIFQMLPPKWLEGDFGEERS